MQLIILIVSLLLSFLFIGIHLNQQNKNGICSLYTKFIVAFMLTFTAILISSSKIQGSYHSAYEVSLILVSLLCLNFASILYQLSNKYEFHNNQHSLSGHYFYLTSFILLGTSTVIAINNQIEFSIVDNLIYLGSLLIGSLIIALIFSYTNKNKIQRNLLVHAFIIASVIFTLGTLVLYLIKVKLFFTFFLIIACLILLIIKFTDIFKNNKNINSYLTTKDFFFYLSQILICLYIYFI